MEVLVNGLALGSIYALVALGFVVVYKTSRVLNFAHAAIGAAGGLIMASLVTDGGLGIKAFAGANPFTRWADSIWGWSLNLVLAMCLAALLGMLIERFAMRPMVGQAQFTMTVVTIGVSISLQVFADRAPIARILRIPWGADTWTVGDVTIAQSWFASIVMAAVLFSAVLAWDKTRMGVASRAVASDVEAAMAQGINTGRVFSLAWAMAAALATAAAVAFSFSPRGVGVISTSGTPGLFFRALPVLAIGGWDSYRGAYLGGLTIGLVQVASGRLFSGQVDILGAGYSSIIPYILMIIVLIVRPAGLFGERTVRRV